jgi:hypothetical protein
MENFLEKHNSKFDRTVFLFLFGILLIPNILHAQNIREHKEEKVFAKDTTKRHIFLGLRYGFGYIFPSDKFVEGDNEEHRVINKYQSFSAKILFQNSGNEKSSWFQVYNHPYLGVGVNVAYFYDIKEMGVPIAIYGFINGPFYRWNKLSFNYEINLGLMGNWRHFNPKNNPYNIAIGAIRTVYLDFGVGLAYRFLPRWEAEFYMGVSHFSNGAIKVPNMGLNTLSPHVEVRYSLHKEQKFNEFKIPPFEKVISLEITAFGGIKNVVSLDSVQVNTQPNYQGVYFPIAGMRTTLNWQISRKSKFGVGLAMTYDGSTDAKIVVENGNMFLKNLPFSYEIRASIYPSYELVIGPFSLVFQPALYLYQKKTRYKLPVFYQRIGFKYTLAHRVTFGFSLRAYRFQVSEFIEWNVGYQFNWKKKK